MQHLWQEVVVEAAHHVPAKAILVAEVADHQHKTDLAHIKVLEVAAEQLAVEEQDLTAKAKTAVSFKADQLAHTVVVVVADIMVVAVAATLNQTV
jgi:hypothetical protein